VAEGARLESVYTGNRIVGSNPTPSARQPLKPKAGIAIGDSVTSRTSQRSGAI
jgi:hypothetical protein